MKKELKTSGYARTMAHELIKEVRKEPKPIRIWYGIPEGSVGLLTGVAKTGKTTFAENLAISLAVGRRRCFGYGTIGEPKKVMFINLEESYKLRSRRLDKQISLLNEKELKLFNENYISTPKEFPDFIETEENWEKLKLYIEENDAEIIFVDSLSHLFSGKIEDSTACLKFVKQKLKPYLTSLGKTVIVIHHNTKGNDKPMDRNSIAGSRVILQEFEYAIGFENIPSETGGNYCCMLYNKHIANDEVTAVVYEIDKNGWFINKGTTNKHNLYKNVKLDLRKNESKMELILEYFKNQYNLGNLIIKTSDLKVRFVQTKIMANDTLHQWLPHMMDKGLIKRIGHGKYQLNQVKKSLYDKIK